MLLANRLCQTTVDDDDCFDEDEQDTRLLPKVVNADAPEFTV